MKRLTTEYIELPDVKLAYRRHGSGPALILLHGNSGSKAFFRRYQLEYFPTFETYAVDSRGHGESVSEDSSYSIARFADDIIAFCSRLGITRADVIGYSDGGNIALFLALKAPRLFNRIVAISPNYLVSGTTDGALKLIRRITKIFEVLGRIGFDTRKSLMRCALMFEDIGISEEELGSIETAMKILYAEHDMVREDHILRLGSLISTASVRKIDRCNHLTILHRKEAVEEIRNFLHS